MMIRCACPPLPVLVAPWTARGGEDRALPDAFLRRCWVLHLELPEERSTLVDWFKRRGRVHFGPEVIHEDALAAAVESLVDWRERLKGLVSCLPGQAELVDLLEAVKELGVPLDKQAKSRFS